MALAFNYKLIGERFFPIIPVRIHRGNKIIETEAYVDSGASISAFHTIIAELAGIDYQRGKTVYPKGTAVHIRAYKNNVEISIGENRFRCDVIFSGELISRFNLLGLQGVFDRFKITFDNKNKKIVFEEH